MQWLCDSTFVQEQTNRLCDHTTGVHTAHTIVVSTADTDERASSESLYTCLQETLAAKHYDKWIFNCSIRNGYITFHMTFALIHFMPLVRVIGCSERYV